MIAQKNIKIINEIFDFFTKKNQAPDVFLQKYYSRNRFIGSKERKLLSEFFYLFIRNRKLIEAIVEYAFPNNTQKIQNCIIVNYILATFNININSKLKERRYFRHQLRRCKKIASYFNFLFF
ncbi:MAG: hypothetical protein B7C24_18330 [Bacteroidetes bacterium 4572_77]|nr:MAG: hypothetical protein B7C24_18330 [Bacteroidetes bacterium 4572_77]